VDSDIYYASHVKWASDNDVVTGISETLFSGDGLITREQAAAIIARYLISVAKVTLPAAGEAFVDQADIGGYASTFVLQLAGAKIIQGLPDGRFNPKANINRAEMATMLVRAVKFAASAPATTESPESTPA
jgi:hypothetical protein